MTSRIYLLILIIVLSFNLWMANKNLKLIGEVIENIGGLIEFDSGVNKTFETNNEMWELHLEN